MGIKSDPRFSMEHTWLMWMCFHSPSLASVGAKFRSGFDRLKNAVCASRGSKPPGLRLPGTAGPVLDPVHWVKVISIGTVLMEGVLDLSWDFTVMPVWIPPCRFSRAAEYSASRVMRLVDV